MDYEARLKSIAEPIEDRTKRVVVVFGSGASVDAGIPTGSEVWEELAQADKLLLNHELDDEAKKADFFSVVDVLVRFRGDEGARRRLQKILRPKFISLVYEIVAHYLHREQIAAVVSLNHDPAFDESLALESPNFLWDVRSRSEFDQLLQEIEDSNELPAAYLKVHGCVSRKLTFRIDRHAVAQLETEKNAVLRRYFGSADVVLCIGWSMHDPDVFRALVESAKPGCSIIVTNSSPTEAMEAILKDLNDDDSCIHTDLIQMNAREFVSQLGNAIEAQTELSYLLPSVGLHRHRIRADCFGPEGPLKVDAATQAALEVIMFALKARAQIEPRTLFECGRTDQLLVQAGKGLDDEPEAGAVRALAEVLRGLCRAEILGTDGRPVFWLNCTTTSKNSEAVLSSIVENVVNNLNRAPYLRDSHSFAEGWEPPLKEHLKALTSAFDVDLHPRARDFAIFSKPTVLRDPRVFRNETAWLLRNAPEGSRLCVSTNTGEWIRNFSDEIVDGGVANATIVVEDYGDAVDSNPFARIATGRAAETRRSLRKIVVESFKAKNKIHQLTAVTTGDQESFERAIYFRREGKSTRISPVLLTAPDDLAIVHAIWSELLDSSSKDPTD